ncbi:MAG: hypothetical protein EXR79_12475 [Myxococcales bacterium]|nr:hypothetical protein [Myxococcales bacterium]
MLPEAHPDIALVLPDANGDAPDSDLGQRPRLIAIDRVWLGVNDLPENVIGNPPASGSVAFHWALPETDWTLDVHVLHTGPGQPAAPPDLQAEGADGQWIDLDRKNVAVAPWIPAPGGSRWTAAVVGSLVSPGTLRLRARVGVVASLPLRVQIAVRTAALHPFDQDDHWLLTFDRDSGKLMVAGSVDTGLQVTATAAPDGTADWIEALEAIGLQGGDAKFNAALRTRLLERMRQHLRTFYHQDPTTGVFGPNSVRVHLHFQGDDPVAWQGKPLSSMAIGGDSPPLAGKPTLFGRASFDARNSGPNDDTKPGYGVFTTAMLRAILSNALSVALVSDFAPAAGGKAFGSVAGDAAFVEPKFDPDALPAGPVRDRGKVFAFAMKYLGLGLAAVTAHEIGHSLGLVQAGWPPHGMLAGEAGPWAVKVTDGYHLDTEGPNLMQTGASFNALDALKDPPFFGPIEIGYLRGRLLVLPK